MQKETIMENSKKSFKIISFYFFFKASTLSLFITCAHAPLDYEKKSSQSNYYSNELLSISYCYFIPSGYKSEHDTRRSGFPLTNGIPFLIFGLLFLGFIGRQYIRRKKNPLPHKEWPQRALF
jgi:hypothetical protein